MMGLRNWFWLSILYDKLTHALVAFLLIGSVMMTMSAGCQFTNFNSFPPKPEGHPKMDSALNQLVHISETKGIAEAIAFAQQSGMKLEDNKVRVIIEAEPGKKDEVIGIATSLGANVETTYENLVQATVPITQLKPLADSADVKLVRLPFEPMPAAASKNQ
jgi:hypothetical protein